MEKNSNAPTTYKVQVRVQVSLEKMPECNLLYKFDSFERNLKSYKEENVLVGSQIIVESIKEKKNQSVHIEQSIEKEGEFFTFSRITSKTFVFPIIKEHLYEEITRLIKAEKGKKLLKEKRLDQCVDTTLGPELGDEQVNIFIEIDELITENLLT